MLLIVLLMFAAPFFKAHNHSLLSSIIYTGLRPVCHQQAARSFHLFAYPLAVCARCTGIYIGVLAGTILFPCLNNFSLARKSAPRRIYIFVALAPVTLDWLLGAIGIWANTHFSRFMTGAFFGAWAAFYIVPAMIECVARPNLECDDATYQPQRFSTAELPTAKVVAEKT